jgi:hypothetical protein
MVGNVSARVTTLVSRRMFVLRKLTGAMASQHVAT